MTGGMTTAQRRLGVIGVVLLVVVVAVVLLVRQTSAPDSTLPGPADVAIDTPELQQIKATTKIAPCEPGTAASGGQLPALTLGCLGGGSAVDLSTLRGPMLINLWGSYCGPCVEELPVLAAFQRDHGDRVPVLGIDFQDVQPGSALALARTSATSYPQLADPGGDLLGSDALRGFIGPPFTIFLDADGNVTYRQSGAFDSEQQIVDLAREHLGVDL